MNPRPLKHSIPSPGNGYLAAVPVRRRLIPTLLVSSLLVSSLPAGAQPDFSEQTPSAKESEPLRLVQAASTSGLDPHLMDTIAGQSVLINLFEALVEIDAAGRIEPALAESWRQPDPRRWIFELRKGVHFHDGRPLRAADVVASFERAMHLPRSQTASYTAAVEKVRADGETRVVIETRHPTPTLLANVAQVRIVPADSPQKIEHPVGTGPYRLLDYLPTHGVSLQAWDGYWGPKPPEERVDFFFIPDAAERLRWLLDGRADLIQILEAARLEQVERSERHEIRRQRSQEVFYLHLNPENPPFDDRRVRCAVDLAIDREALADAALGGHAETAGQLVGDGSFGYSPQIEATRVDRRRARRLLAEAGHAEGATLILYHPRGAENVATVLRDHLGKVGIRVALRGIVWHDFFELLRHTELPAYLAGWSESTFDAASVFGSLVHSKDAGRGFGDMNFTGYSHPGIDRRIERATREMDPDARRSQLESISREVREDCAFLPLVWPLEHFGVGKDIEWTPRLDGLLRAVDMRRRSR